MPSGLRPAPRLRCRVEPPRRISPISRHGGRVAWYGNPGGGSRITRAFRKGSGVTKGKEKEPGYREAVAEIDAILAALEDRTGLDIDELAGKVERAAHLIQLLHERLQGAEARVRKVTAELARASDDATAEENGEERADA